MAMSQAMLGAWTGERWRSWEGASPGAGCVTLSLDPSETRCDEGGSRPSHQ